jgi:hypothetical protein
MTRQMLCAGVLAVAAAAAYATPAFAQIPVGTYVGGPASGYDSAARRDPFVSLIVPKRPTTQPTADGPRGTGLRSLALADVEVTGVVRRGDLMLAILKGTGEQSYVARVKDRLMDAEIKQIDGTGVVFVAVIAPGTGGRPQEIRKALRGAAEGNR